MNYLVTFCIILNCLNRFHIIGLMCTTMWLNGSNILRSREFSFMKKTYVKLWFIFYMKHNPNIEICFSRTLDDEINGSNTRWSSFVLLLHWLHFVAWYVIQNNPNSLTCIWSFLCSYLGWNHRGVYILSRQPTLETKIKRKLSPAAHRRMRIDYRRFNMK